MDTLSPFRKFSDGERTTEDAAETHLQIQLQLKENQGLRERGSHSGSSYFGGGGSPTKTTKRGGGEATGGKPLAKGLTKATTTPTTIRLWTISPTEDRKQTHPWQRWEENAISLTRGAEFWWICVRLRSTIEEDEIINLTRKPQAYIEQNMA